MMQSRLLAAVLATSTMLVAQKDALVLPPNAVAAEGNATAFWFASPFQTRQQLLIDGSELVTHKGRTVVGIQIRRNTGHNTKLSGGKIYVELDLSTSTTPVADTSPHFDRNHGANRVAVFKRWVHFPAANPSPRIPAEWATPHALTLAFPKGFQYDGGRLCIETRTTTTGKANTTPWWPVDARDATVGGQVTPVGTSCIPELPDTPASADASTLVPGATARLYLAGRLGTPTVGILTIGSQSATIRLDAFGAPGCIARVLGIAFLPVPYSVYPPGKHGAAIARLDLPRDPRFVGAALWSQWIVPTASTQLGLGFSNAAHLRLGSAISTSYSTVSATSSKAATGDVAFDRHPVIRLLFQKNR